MILIFMSMRHKSSREILDGVYRAAKEHDWRVQLFDTFPDRTRLKEILHDWNPTGCIVFTGDVRDLLPPRLFGSIPVVYLGDRRPGRLAVIQDAAATARLAADELSACGAGAFAYVAPEEETAWNRERCRAFRAEAVRRNVPFRMYRLGRPGLEDFLKNLPKPAGVFAAADAYATEVVRAAERARLAIPRDLALVSVDNDMQICENLRPTLTSVEHAFEHAGYLLAQTIAERLNHPGSPIAPKTYQPQRIVSRASTLVAGIPPQIAAAREFIRRHATEGIGVGDVAHQLGLNRRALERIFAQQGGPSVATLIRDGKLEAVLELLRKPGQAISPIASLCGFSSEAHLKTLFKKTYGLTMRDWRKAHARPGPNSSWRASPSRTRP